MRKVVPISLTPHLANMVDAVVKTGHYKTRSKFFQILLVNWLNEQMSQDETSGKFTKLIRQMNAALSIFPAPGHTAPY